MNKTILIAEDDQFLTKMYKFHLAEQQGWTIEIVGNGEEAIAAMDKQQPDILLLDLLMPKLDGYGVMEHVRAKKYTFPVLIMSNLSQQIDQQKCKELGAQNYFIKSEVEMEQLVEIINKYL